VRNQRFKSPFLIAVFITLEIMMTVFIARIKCLNKKKCIHLVFLFF